MNTTTDPTEIHDVEPLPEAETYEEAHARRLAEFRERRREADRLRKAAWRARTGAH